MDIHLHYREAGSGDVMLLLHGNDENGGYFKHQIEYFSKKYRVIAPDTRGHGESPRGTAPFSIHQFAVDLNDFMDELGIERAIILGFSDGANIAMDFALHYPEKVRVLILNAGNLYPSGMTLPMQLSIEIGYRIAKRAAAKSPEALRRAEMLEIMAREPNLKPEDLHRITAPTLVIAGTNDVIRSSHTKEIAANLPLTRLAIIPGPHAVAAKSPERFNEEVEKFLQAAAVCELA